MAYTVLTAVEHPTCPVKTGELTGTTTPALPTTALGANNGEAMPSYRSSTYDEDPATWSAEEMSMTGPGIFCRGFVDAGALCGFAVMGVDGTGAYGLKVAGTTNTNAYDPFYWSGYADGLAVLFRDTAITGSVVDIEYLRQEIGGFTGGTAAPVALNSVETTSIDFGYDVSVLAYHGMGPAIDSTPADPVVNIYLQALTTPGDDLTYMGERLAALRIPASGAPSLRSIMWTDLDPDVTSGQNMFVTVLGTIQKDNNTYILWQSGDSADLLNMTILETEPVWPTLPTYTNYTLEFGGGLLPTNPALAIAGEDFTWLVNNITASDDGWMISFKHDDGAGNVTSRFFLVDPDWQYYQEYVFTAGDSTAQGILNQSETNDFYDMDSWIGLALDTNGKSLLLGGTNAVPAFGYCTSSCGDEGNTDDDVRLRVWAFSLDGHDFYVLRLGASATLVYDLTTGTWSEWESPSRDNLRAHVGQNWVGMSATTLDTGFDTDVVAGDDTTGTLWILGTSTGMDDNVISGSSLFNRAVTGGVALTGREVKPCNALQLEVSLGRAASDDATIELLTSDDFGNTWTTHASQTITAADYSQILEWRSLGLMRHPGRVFKITDNGATVRIGRAELR